DARHVGVLAGDAAGEAISRTVGRALRHDAPAAHEARPETVRAARLAGGRADAADPVQAARSSGAADRCRSSDDPEASALARLRFTRGRARARSCRVVLGRRRSGRAPGRRGPGICLCAAKHSELREDGGGGMQQGRGIRDRGAGRCLRIVCLGVVMMTLLMPRPARAIIGHYTAGVPNTHDFFVPPEEGLFFALYTYIYHTDSFRDRNGNPVDHLIVPPRLRPPSTLPLDVTLNQVALSPAILWVPHFTLLGALRRLPQSRRRQRQRLRGGGGDQQGEAVRDRVGLRRRLRAAALAAVEPLAPRPRGFVRFLRADGAVLGRGHGQHRPRLLDAAVASPGGVLLRRGAHVLAHHGAGLGVQLEGVWPGSPCRAPLVAQLGDQQDLARRHARDGRAGLRSVAGGLRPGSGPVAPAVRRARFGACRRVPARQPEVGRLAQVPPRVRGTAALPGPDRDVRLRVTAGSSRRPGEGARRVTLPADTPTKEKT